MKKDDYVSVVAVERWRSENSGIQPNESSVDDEIFDHMCIDLYDFATAKIFVNVFVDGSSVSVVTDVVSLKRMTVVLVETKTKSLQQSDNEKKNAV